MIAASAGLTDADLDGLFADAVAAEVAGRYEEALASLTIAIAELCARGQTYQYPFEWLARLQCELGDFAAAERSLLVARTVAEQVDHRPGVFRIDVARARVACAVPDLATAERLLSELRNDDDVPLGPPSPERSRAMIAWLAALKFRDRPAQNIAVLQVEAVMVIGELWAEQGKYLSALALVGELEGKLEDARVAIRREQVELLRVEWLLAAGELAEAERRLAQANFGEGVDAIRAAVVRGRAALLGGRLAQVVSQLELIDTAPVTSPALFAYATALRIAVQLELNLHTAATETAAAAIGKLGDEPGVQPLVALLENAKLGAAARRRSAIALWELPVLASVDDVAVDSEWIVFDASSAGGSRFTVAWTTAANAVLVALERGDLAAAIAQHGELERITLGVESRFITARVRLSAALIEYCRGPDETTLAELLEVAQALHAIGARHDEAQAVRFAARASARLGRTGDYLALARRAASIIDEIAGELDATTRTAYLMNKWNGRDELVAGRMRELLADGSDRPRRPRRREILQVFRQIDDLTHWPIDDAFAEDDARKLAGNATSDLVLEWLAERRSSVSVRAGSSRGFALRSALSLWWFPARTLVLHYHVLPDRTYLFRIARRHLDVMILPVGRVHLRMNMRALVDDREQLRWLATHLGVADSLDKFCDLRRLVIVPHDAIANIPFAVLPVRGGALCEQVAITQLDRLSRLRRRGRRTAVGRFVTVGLSSYAGSGQVDLPETETEAYAVAAALGIGTADSYMDAAATRTGVRAALPGATHMHIAAHGIFDHTHPADSGVLLRDDNGYATLTLHELRELDLRRMQLATLATCRSAESAQLPGRERICLPTALLDAGTRGVIASLWPVEDEPSVEVMTDLYRRLRTELPATALAHMQADQRKASRSAHNWAGLVFYGND
jgi:CHAT domain-containing protein